MTGFRGAVEAGKEECINLGLMLKLDEICVLCSKYALKSVR
jgi:hypothetical protein